MKTKRGKLIVLEGTDAAGKTTQSKLLKKWIEGFLPHNYPLLISFPVYSTWVGDVIYRGLHDQLGVEYTKEIQCLLMTANRYELLPTIRHALCCGRHVILNRYYPSNLVYGRASGVDKVWLKSLDKLLPKPDIVLVLVTEPGTIDKRRHIDQQDSFEIDKKYSKKVMELWIDLTVKNHWKFIDAERSIEQVHTDIVNLVKRLL